MGMPAALDQYCTRDMVLAFPEDGNRYELVHGELLVSPASSLSHQLVVRRLHNMGVPLYWIIDPARERAECWTPGAQRALIEESCLEWRPANASESSLVTPAELFAA
ncbi:MAG: hypothetical protein ACT4P7_10530 [Gemmatimonadaceae bacterium]